MTDFGTLPHGGQLVLAGSFKKVRRNVLDADTTSDVGAVICLRGAPPWLEHVL